MTPVEPRIGGSRRLELGEPGLERGDLRRELGHPGSGGAVRRKKGMEQACRPERTTCG